MSQLPKHILLIFIDILFESLEPALCILVEHVHEGTMDWLLYNALSKKKSL